MPQLIEPHLLFDWARELGKEHPFWDVHVHPFEVLTGDVAFLEHEKIEGLFSKPGSVYHPPIAKMDIEPEDEALEISPGSSRAYLLASRLKYTHTGHKVITDQLKTAGLSGALLLPVARIRDAAQAMLEATAEMFSGDDHLIPGCAFPVRVPANELTRFFITAHDRYRIRAIKIHPNLAGINPLTSAGRDLIEATLEVAGKLDLPVVVHSGRTAVLRPSYESEYGTLQRLETINWSLSAAPVILAHAGCHDLTEEEARVALSRLNLLFQKHPNLMANTSNLAPSIQRLVLEKVDRSRLLFGSDALYVPIWKAWLQFLHTLRNVSYSPDHDLIRMASLNPMQCLGLLKTT